MNTVLSKRFQGVLNMDNNNQHQKYKIYPKSERITAVFLLLSVLVWGFYDSYTTGNFGAPFYIIIMTSVVNVIARKYYSRKDLKKEKDINK